MLKCHPGVFERRRRCVCLLAVFVIIATGGRAPVRALADADAAATGQFDLLRGDAGRTSAVADNISGPLSLMWKASITAGKGNLSPVYANGVVYVAMGSEICALRVSDGGTIWTLTGKARFNASPVIQGDYLYIGADDSDLYKVSLKDGSVAWQNKFDAQIRSAPVAANGRIYFGTESGNVYAVDPDAGGTIWTYTAGGPVSTPLVVSDDGAQIFFAAGDGKVYGVDADSGRNQWSIMLPADPSIAPPVFADDCLYVSAERDLYALNPRRGGVRWRQHFDGGITTSPAIGQGAEFVTTDDDQVVALDDRGRKIWSATSPYFCNGGALLAGNTLVVPFDHGIVYAYDAATGAVRWDYVLRPTSEDKDVTPSTAAINCPPVYVDDTLFLLSSDGTLSAFQPNALDQTPPVIYSMEPTPGATFDPKNVTYKAVLFDEGSGVDADSVTLTVDGKVLDGVAYDPVTNGLKVKSSVSTGDETLPDLDDGPHTVVVKASDWKGNTLTKKWGFYVKNPNAKAVSKNGSATATTTTVVAPDSSVPVPPAANSQPAGGGSAAQSSGGGSGMTVITGGSSTPGQGSGASATAHAPASGGGSGSSGGSSGGASSSGGGASSGGSSSGGGSGAGTTGVTGPGSQPAPTPAPSRPVPSPSSGPPPPPI